MCTADEFCQVLGSFLDVEALASLWSCSHHFRTVTVPLLVPRVQWRASTVEKWPGDSDKLPFVARVIVDIEHLVEGVLPASLTQLSFGTLFTQPLVEGVLPASLTQLSFVISSTSHWWRVCCRPASHS